MKTIQLDCEDFQYIRELFEGIGYYINAQIPSDHHDQVSTHVEDYYGRLLKRLDERSIIIKPSTENRHEALKSDPANVECGSKEECFFPDCWCPFKDLSAKEVSDD